MDSFSPDEDPVIYGADAAGQYGVFLGPPERAGHVGGAFIRPGAGVGTNEGWYAQPPEGIDPSPRGADSGSGSDSLLHRLRIPQAHGRRTGGEPESEAMPTTEPAPRPVDVAAGLARFPLAERQSPIVNLPDREATPRPSIAAKLLYSRRPIGPRAHVQNCLSRTSDVTGGVLAEFYTLPVTLVAAALDSMARHPEEELTPTLDKVTHALDNATTIGIRNGLPPNLSSAAANVLIEAGIEVAQQRLQSSQDNAPGIGERAFAWLAPNAAVNRNNRLLIRQAAEAAAAGASIVGGQESPAQSTLTALTSLGLPEDSLGYNPRTRAVEVDGNSFVHALNAGEVHALAVLGNQAVMGVVGVRNVTNGALLFAALPRDVTDRTTGQTSTIAEVYGTTIAGSSIAVRALAADLEERGRSDQAIEITRADDPRFLQALTPITSARSQSTSVSMGSKAGWPELPASRQA